MAKTWDSRIARTLVQPLRGTAVHPNHLTTLGLLIGLAAAALFASGSECAADGGGVLLVLAMIVDHADGELARMTGKTSAFGHTYDRFADLTVKLATFLGMGVGVRGALGAWGPLLGASAGIALVTIFRARSALAARRGAEIAFRQPSGGGFEIEDVLYLIAPITWLGALPYFVVTAGIGAPVFAAWTLLVLRRAVVADRARAAPPGAPVAAASSNPPGGLPAALARPGLAAGLAILTALIAYHGFAEVARALAVAGWGLLVVAAYHGVPLLADALGWRRLLDDRAAPGRRTFIRARWIGESVNGLLPVMQIGGNVAKARFLARRGVDGVVAGASVVVDVTLVVLTQVTFSLCGVVLLLGHLGHGRLGGTALAGAAMMALLVAAFFVAQRSGLFAGGVSALERAVGTLGGRSYRRDGEALDAEVAALYRRRSALLAASSWHFASWVLGTGEVWLALAFLGHPVGILDAVLLESLGQALRAAAFVIPGALGVQEGGFLVLGGLLGLAPETCLALSLSKRARELLLGVPGLIAWQAEAGSALVAAGERWTPLEGTER